MRHRRRENIHAIPLNVKRDNRTDRECRTSERQSVPFYLSMSLELFNEQKYLIKAEPIENRRMFASEPTSTVKRRGSISAGVTRKRGRLSGHRRKRLAQCKASSENPVMRLTRRGGGREGGEVLPLLLLVFGQSRKGGRTTRDEGRLNIFEPRH